jgi:hypothetical protein
MPVRELRKSISTVAIVSSLWIGLAASSAGESDGPAWLRLDPDLSDGPVTVYVHSADGGVQGWSFGICHDPNVASQIGFRETDELLTIRDGLPPAFLVTEEGSDLERGGVVQAVVLDFVQHRVLPVTDGAGFPVLEVNYSTESDTSIALCAGLRGSGEPVEAVITIDGATYRPPLGTVTTLVPPPQAWFRLAPEISNGQLTVFVNSINGGIQGWSYSVCYDPEKATVLRFDMTPEMATLNNDQPPDFYWQEIGSGDSLDGVIQASVTAFVERIYLPGETEGGFPALEVEFDVLEETEVTICADIQGSGEPVAVVVTIDGETSRLPRQRASATLIIDPYADTLAFRTLPEEVTDVVTVKLYSQEAAVEGWSFTLCNTAENAQVLEVQSSPQLDQLVGGEPPEFVYFDARQVDSVITVRQTVTFGTSIEPVAIGPFVNGIALLDIRYDVGAEDTLKFCDHVGSQSFDNFVTIEGINYIPRTRVGSRLVVGDLGSRFTRGDADLTGIVNLTDAIHILNALFLAGPPLLCMDAADVNDVGRVDIADPIYLMRFLFIGGPQPPAPFPQSGTDLSPDTAHGCERGI